MLLSFYTLQIFGPGGLLLTTKPVGRNKCAEECPFDCKWYNQVKKNPPPRILDLTIECQGILILR